MAVASNASTSGSKQKNPGAKKEKKQPKKKSEAKSGVSSPPKRNSCPGLRVVHGRIYDSQNGKTCHQCRQKTMDFMASCRNLKKGKACSINYCHKCLLNRYGENAEEVAALGDWSCPKCKEICNCSFCMKKRGQQPTGTLVRTAKATGFSSVSEMLQVNGPDIDHGKFVANIGSSPKKVVPSSKDVKMVSPRKRAKENSFRGKLDSNMHPLSSSNPDSEIVNEGEYKETASENQNGADDRVKLDKLKKDVGALSKNSIPGNGEEQPKKSKEKGKCKEEDLNIHLEDSSRNKRRKVEKDNDMTQTAPLLDSGYKHSDGTLSDVITDTVEVNSDVLQNQNNDDVDILLPQGVELTTIAGIELSQEDVGHALQFLEFCAVFAKVLELKKGQPELVLSDMFSGRTGRRGKYSLTVQFHIQLLSLIEEEKGEGSASLSPGYGENSWFSALKIYISESPIISNILPLRSLDNGAEGYEEIGPSIKLRILNFLCDEVLETAKIRTWIEDENSGFAKKSKEAKESIRAAKDKEKHLRQKMQDKIAKALMAKNGAPLSISEHEAIVSKIKQETAKAHSAVLESKGLLLNNIQRPDAIRREPFFLDINGRAYWKLNCYSDKCGILLQDTGGGDHTLAPEEKWFAFDAEQKDVIEKYIKSCARRRSILLRGYASDFVRVPVF